MRILHIFRDISPQGGAARAMIAIAKYSPLWGDYQHEIVNLLPVNYNSTNAKLAQAIGLPVSDSSNLSEKISASDIVHLHWWKDATIDQFLQSDWLPMRLLIWFHTAGDFAPHVITPELIDFADMAVACNPYTYEKVFPDYSSARQKLAMVYGAADFEPLEHIRLRQHDGFNVGYVGSLTKLHPDFVKMSVGLNIPGIRFTLCGGGANAPKIAQQVSLAQADARFLFAGYVNDVRTYLETFDVFGYPSNLESAGYAGSELVIQEAMYAGIPPVVFPVGGIGHLVMDGYTGLVVHDSIEYQRAIEYLYHYPEERFRLGGNAASYARQIFGAANAAPKMNALYTAMMEQPKRQHTYSTFVLLLQEQEKDDKPQISIVVSGRNDDYGGDFEGRFMAAYRRNCLELEKAGIEAEWIFIEWNPPNENYLSYTLADKGFKCYVVDPDIHGVVCSSPQMEFMQFFAKNVGMRRASNPWVLVTNPDCVFGPKVLAEIAKGLDPLIIYRAERRDIDPAYFTRPFPDMFHHITRIHDSWGGLRITEAAGDFMLFNKESLPLCYDEHIGFSDAGTDGRILLNAMPMGCAGLRFLGSVFKADHPLLFCKQREAEYTSKGRTNWNYKYGLPYSPTPDWGMDECTETELAPNIWYLSDDDKRRKMFEHWIDTFGHALGRKDFHDQTPESLLAITAIVHQHQPTKIVELGTFMGLSLRTWLHASEAPVVSVDWNLDALKKSLCLLPEDLTRVGLLRQDASQVDYAKLWDDDDVVLLYIDIHGDAAMTQLLRFAVPLLPLNSLVIVDDLWYSPNKLTDENILTFFNESVRPQIDISVANVPGSYAHYWKGGSFVGFKEVVPLMEYINDHQIELNFEAGVKIVSWRT